MQWLAFKEVEIALLIHFDCDCMITSKKVHW